MKLKLAKAAQCIAMVITHGLVLGQGSAPPSAQVILPDAFTSNYTMPQLPDVRVPQPPIPQLSHPDSGVLGLSRTSVTPHFAAAPVGRGSSVLDSFTSSSTSPLGYFPPMTNADRELEAMLADPAGNIDLALASYLIASELPAYGGMSREEFQAAVDRATMSVASMLQRASSDARLRMRRSNPTNKVFDFCDAVRLLGVDYNDQFKSTTITPQQTAALYRDERNIFLPGLLATKRGSCVSMPMLYLCVGRRLDLPVHLVNIGKHSFIRWDEPGLRLSIETTIVSKAAITDKEDIFLETEGLTRADTVGTDWLRNLSDREIVGWLLHSRGGCYYARGRDFYDLAYRDCHRAATLAPENKFIKAQLAVLEKELAPLLPTTSHSEGAK